MISNPPNQNVIEEITSLAMHKTMNEVYTFGDSMIKEDEIIETIRRYIIDYRDEEFDASTAYEGLDELRKRSEDDEYSPLLSHFYALILRKSPTEEATVAFSDSGDKDLNKLLRKVEVWRLQIDELAKNSSSFAKEILVVSLYRYYRAYNEAYEHILLSRGRPAEKFNERHELQSGAIDDVLDDSQVERSEHWRKIVFFDSAQEYEKRLFKKSYDEYHILMTNEKIVFDKRHGVTKQYDTYKTTSLDGFFSNEIPYLVSSLLKQLVDMFPTGEDGDRKYISCWERVRIPNEKSADEKLFDSFNKYRKDVKRLSVYMRMILECHQDGEDFRASSDGVFRNKIIEDKMESIRLTDEGIRFHTFLEVTYLHNLIAVDVAESIYFQKQLENFCSSFLRNRTDERFKFAKRRTFLRTKYWHPKSGEKFISGDDFAKWLTEKGAEPFFYHGSTTEGRAYALLMLWFSERELPGLFLALSSNGFKGDLIAQKTERDPDSSNWGNKVILKDGTKYIQLCQSLPHEDLDTTRMNLSDANRFFNFQDAVASGLSEVINLKSSFMTTTFVFDEIRGEPLQTQWNRECGRYSTDRNLSYIQRLSSIIMEYFFSITKRKKTVLVEPLDDLVYSEDSTNEGLLHPKPGENMTYWFLEWLHGDEWGKNFTVYDQRLYAIDLEDCVKNHHRGDKTKARVGGTHAGRFTSDDTFPLETFCAISSAGRLIGALCQKIVLDMREDGVPLDFCNHLISQIKLGIEEAIKESYNNPPLKGEEIDSLNYQFWYSFFNWLRYWTTKEIADNELKKFDKEEISRFQDAYNRAYSSQSEEDE